MDNTELYSVLGIGNNFYYQINNTSENNIKIKENLFFKDLQKYHYDRVFIIKFIIQIKYLGAGLHYSIVLMENNDLYIWGMLNERIYKSPNLLNIKVKIKYVFYLYF